MKNIEQTKRQKQAETLRWVRKLHRFAGIWLFLFLFVIGITGLLLGWKKNSYGMILAETQVGISSNTKNWITIDSVLQIAKKFLLENGYDSTIGLSRVDVRIKQGVYKLSFTNIYKGLQIDATTGKILMIENRNADLVEQIHDGSIVDEWIGWKTGYWKLLYTTLCGLGLIIFTITGFWLWYGPKRMRA